MIKIVYFITDLGIGGAENILFSMLKKLDRDKYFPIVCCLYGGELFNKIKELNIEVVDLKIRKKWDLSVFPKFYRLLRKEKPDIIHTHLFHANIIGRLMAKSAGMPVVVSTQHYSSGFHGPLGILAERLTAPLTVQIIAVSEAAKRFCVEKEGIPEEKIKVIYNGIDFKYIDAQKSIRDLRKHLSLSNDPLIGCVGRFVKVKGYEYLFYAAQEIIKYYPEANLILLGYGPQKHELMRLADRLNLSKKVIFLEPSIGVNEFMSILDVYVLPSLSEGLSVTLLEAMAMARPIVATNVGGNPEVIIDSVTGLLVPPRDSGALSKAIISILKNTDFGKRMAVNARKRAEEKFNIDIMARNIEVVYDSLRDKLKLKL